MSNSRENYEMKVFEINTSSHLLKGKNNSALIVQHIVDHHRSRIKDFDNIGKPIQPIQIEPVTYYSYLNENDDKTAYWKAFLPEIITPGQEFKIKALTYTLFACIENKIYAIIGGGGSMVIKKFQNHKFGIELFEYITDLNEDLVSVTTRGISGNLTLNSSTYRDGQKLLDTLNFTNIPSSIVLVLKDEIKNSLFDFIDFGIKRVTLEIGAYFHIKHKINFQELHQLFIRFNEIPKNSEPRSLTSFVQIKDLDKIEEFKNILFYEIREDAANRFGPGRGTHPKKLDIDFIHPSKIQEFYQADYFEIKEKNARKGLTLTDRSELYQRGLEWIYDKTSHLNQLEFNQYVGGLRTYTWKGKERIKGMFWQYLTCEISYQGKPVFHIDGNWYKVIDNFETSISQRASQIIDNNYLDEEILSKTWGAISEGEYNRGYENETGYTIFDKALGQKIELCDIMYETDSTIYLIHVKAGFDAKMRDLGNQIVIAANRLMNDRNSGSTKFLSEVIDNYNNREENVYFQVNKEDYLEKFKTGGKNIVFVLAYKPETKKLARIKGNLELVNSNIAKFSLIQCVREMNSLSYPVKIVEISR